LVFLGVDGGLASLLLVSDSVDGGISCEVEVTGSGGRAPFGEDFEFFDISPCTGISSTVCVINSANSSNSESI